MKNKKLVATVASLCLVVVAVVAAVVGVFAAVTQKVSNTFEVKYVAKNVHAQVSLDSMGPTYSNGGRENSSDWEYTTTGSGQSETRVDVSQRTFLAGEKTATKSLSAKAYNLGWDSDANSQNFLGTAVYRFTFQNLASLSGKISISFTYATGTPEYLTVYFYEGTTSAAASLNIDSFVVTRAQDATGSASVATPSGLTAKEYTAGTAVNLTDLNDGSTSYLFMVVLVTNIQHNNSASLTDLGALLSFTLTNPVTAA